MLSSSQEAAVNAAGSHALVLSKNALVADGQRRIHPEVFEVMRTHYLDQIIPSTYGGQGVDAVTCGLSLMKLAYGDASPGLVLAMHHFVMRMLGRPDVSEETKEYFYALARSSLFCAAISEPGSTGHDPESFVPSQVVAKRRPDGSFELWGKKSVVSGSDLAGHVMVFARLEGAEQTVVCLVVKMGSDGMTVGREWDSSICLRSTSSNSILFEGTPVSRDGFIFQTDDFLREVMVQEGARTFGSMAVYPGLFRRLLEISEEAVKDRIPNGRMQPVAYLPQVATGIYGHGVRLRNAERALVDSLRAYDLRHDEETVKAAFLAMCDAKDNIGELTRAVPDLQELAGQAAMRKPLFELGSRDISAGNFMPPNTPAVRLLGGYTQLKLKM
jgi:alkylation response protein AidB-like acyl-CoA dehydrogenase